MFGAFGQFGAADKAGVRHGGLDMPDMHDLGLDK